MWPSAGKIATVGRFSQEVPNRVGIGIFTRYDFIMGVEKTINALRTSCMSLGPGAFAIKLGWLLPASLVLGYLALMPVMLLPDVSLEAYTALYITAATLALPAMLATIAGTWMVYAYFYVVTVPVVRSMERGRSLAHLAINVAGNPSSDCSNGLSALGPSSLGLSDESRPHIWHHRRCAPYAWEFLPVLRWAGVPAHTPRSSTHSTPVSEG